MILLNIINNKIIIKYMISHNNRITKWQVGLLNKLMVMSKI